jgi:cytochrome c nitrite reductase small subunit
LIDHVEYYQQNPSITDKERLCWDCHRFTPHGREKSLSSVEFARIPALDPVVPDWIREALHGSEKDTPKGQGRQP